MKRVLVVGFSQTGQLHKILQAIGTPLEQENIHVEYAELKPVEPYAFPWSILNFFDVFPESVYLDPKPNQPLNLQADFDLVILGFQPWFLSPSLPTTAFLQSVEGKNLLANKPVVTVIGSRNMWGQAWLEVKKLLADIDANVIGNIVLEDQGNSLETFITTPRWLLTGKKNRFLGLSPAGISEQDIAESARFGKAIAKAFKENQALDSQILQGLGAVKAKAGLLQSEKIGKRGFRIWGSFLRKLGRPGCWRRKPVLLIYIVFLILMIITVVPISMLVRKLIAVFNPQASSKLEQEFEQPSGSDRSRIREFL